MRQDLKDNGDERPRHLQEFEVKSPTFKKGEGVEESLFQRLEDDGDVIGEGRAPLAGLKKGTREGSAEGDPYLASIRGRAGPLLVNAS